MGTLPAQPARLLIADADPGSLQELVGVFSSEYRIEIARTGTETLQKALAPDPPDLILMDVGLPQLDGYEVLTSLRNEPTGCEIPVVFVSSRREFEEEVLGLALGAIDFIQKPVSAPIARMRVRNHLELCQCRRLLRQQNRMLEFELILTQAATIDALASLAETRDNETGAHIRRTQKYVELLATLLGTLEDDTVELMSRSAPLHDIGKVGIPDHILLKPGKLTDEEFEVIKRHPKLGHDALLRAEQQLAGNNSFLHIARDIAYSHHEKWNGSGYPQGLSEGDIPLAGRIMAIADVYDALISKRCYKPGYTHEQAVEIMAEGKGSHFDPQLCDLFLRNAQRFREVAALYAD